MPMQTDMPLTTAGQNRYRKYNLNMAAVCFSKTGSSCNLAVDFTIFGTLRDLERLRRLALLNGKLEVDALQ